MIQKKKNKKKIGVILCAMFICLCSILCIIPFNKQDKIDVYADEVSVTTKTFTSSPILVPCTLSTSNSSFNFITGYSDLCWFYYTFDVNSSNEIVSLTFYVNSTFVYGDYYDFMGWKSMTITPIYSSSVNTDNGFYVFNSFIRISNSYSVYLPIRTAFYTLDTYSLDSTKVVPKFVDFYFVDIGNSENSGYNRTTFSYYNSSADLKFFTSVFCPSASVLYSGRRYYFEIAQNFTNNE